MQVVIGVRRRRARRAPAVWLVRKTPSSRAASSRHGQGLGGFAGDLQGGALRRPFDKASNDALYLLSLYPHTSQAQSHGPVTFAIRAPSGAVPPAEAKRGLVRFADRPAATCFRQC